MCKFCETISLLLTFSVMVRACVRACVCVCVRIRYRTTLPHASLRKPARYLSNKISTWTNVWLSVESCVSRLIDALAPLIPAAPPPPRASHPTPHSLYHTHTQPHTQNPLLARPSQALTRSTFRPKEQLAKSARGGAQLPNCPSMTQTFIPLSLGVVILGRR